MNSEDRIKKMRTIAIERFVCHIHSSVWFLDRALEWFNRDDGCLSLQCSEKRLWIATFDHVYDNGEQHICWSGEGDSALDAIVELLWDMRGHV